MAEVVQIHGLRELQAALAELPRRIDRRVLNAALMAGARPMVKDAQARAPVLTGALRFAIRARPVRPKEHTATVVVGVGGAKQEERMRRGKLKKVWVRAKNFVFYWIFQEFGTSHQAARPFIRPAFEANKTSSVQIIKEALGRRIEAEAQKLKK